MGACLIVPQPSKRVRAGVWTVGDGQRIGRVAAIPFQMLYFLVLLSHDYW